MYTHTYQNQCNASYRSILSRLLYIAVATVHCEEPAQVQSSKCLGTVLEPALLLAEPALREQFY